MSQTIGQRFWNGESEKMAKNKMAAEMYKNRPKLGYEIAWQGHITVLNSAKKTCHWNILKVLSKIFPNLQTKRKSVQKWRTQWGLKSCLSTNLTIFRTFFNTLSQIPKPNIAIPTSHRYALKVLSNTFPNMQTKPKSVQKWRTYSDSKSGFKQWFHHFSQIFQHHFPNSAAKYCNTNISLVYS